MADAAGNVVSGTYKQSGKKGKDIKLKPDKASKASLRKMLLQSALDCDGIDAGPKSKEQLLSMKVKLKSYVLRAEIKNQDTLHVTAKLKGTVKWKKKHKKHGKYYGSGSTLLKLRAQAPLAQTRTDVPPVCGADASRSWARALPVTTPAWWRWGSVPT